MIIPIRTDYRMTRTPWVNYSLVAVNVAVYLLGFHAASEAGFRRILALMLQPDEPLLGQFFTSMFLHGNFWHLAGNMLFLWVFGNGINDRFGNVGYLAFYLAGGALAGVGYLLLGGDAPVLGASGAISAVTGAYLVLLPRTRVTVLVLLIYILTPFDLSSLYFLAFQFIWNFLLTLGGLGGQYVNTSGVAYAAHSAGYVYGIAVSMVLLAVKVVPGEGLDLLSLLRLHRRRTSYSRMTREGYNPFGPVSPSLRRQAGQSVDARTVEQAPSDTPAARELTLRREISEALLRHDLPSAASKYLELVQVADEPVLSQAQQLDVANQLMASEQHAAAADAYERFLKHYRQYEYAGDIYLMLGLLYGRYLHRTERAEHCLRQAVESLSDDQKLELARSELSKLRRGR